MLLTEETEVQKKNTYHSTTVPTTHPTQSGLRMNPHVRSWGPTTNRLSHGTAVPIC
jgi:hypothetical protein